MKNILVALGLLASTAYADITTSTTTVPSVYVATTPAIIGTSTQDIISFASSTFEGTPLMAVASCESGDGKGSVRQFNDDGSILQGVVNPQDHGLLQINMKYHGEEAKAMGFDLDTTEGNAYFGLWLYRTQGLDPWKASEKCWRKLMM